MSPETTTATVTEAPVVPASPAGATRPPRPVGLRAFLARHDRALLGIVTTVVLLGLWQLIASVGLVSTEFISYPTQIAQSVYTYFTTGNGWSDLGTSGLEFVIGLALAVAAGVPLGLTFGWFPRVDAMFGPVVTLLYNSPRIVLAPLFVIWFGIGVQSKIAIVFLAAVFPVLINSRAGVANTDPVLVAMARSWKATNLQILRTIVLPGSIPSISSGIRLGVGQGLLGMVLAEFIASTGGLGFTVNTAASNLDTPLLFSAVLIIALLGILLTSIFRRVERYFEKWRT